MCGWVVFVTFLPSSFVGGILIRGIDCVFVRAKERCMHDVEDEYRDFVRVYRDGLKGYD